MRHGSNFRALRLDTQEFIKGDLTRLVIGSNIRYFIKPLDCKMIEVDPKSISVETPFKDSKQKTIYEGDVLSSRVKSDEGIITSNCQVFWNELTGAWCLDNSFKQNKTFFTLLYKELEHDDLKISSNIYQSPELINQS